MTLAAKLTALFTSKNAIRDAIEAKGVSLTGIPFSNYADEIASIETGGSPSPTDPTGYLMQGINLIGNKRKTLGASVNTVIGTASVASDGKLVHYCNIESWITGTPNNNLVVRQNTDGTFDESFGENGAIDLKVLFSSATLVSGVSIKHVPSNKILLACVNATGATLLARLLSDGTLDATFGTAGIVTMDAAEDGQYAVQMEYHNSKVWVLVHENVDDHVESVLYRFTQDGQPETTPYESDRFSTTGGIVIGASFFVARESGGFYIVTNFFNYGSQSELEDIAADINYTGSMTATYLSHIRCYDAAGEPDLIYTGDTKALLTKELTDWVVQTVVDAGDDKLYYVGSHQGTPAVMRTTPEIEADVTYGDAGLYLKTGASNAFSSVYVDPTTRDIALTLNMPYAGGQIGVVLTKLTSEGELHTDFTNGPNLLLIPPFAFNSQLDVYKTSVGFIVLIDLSYGSFAQIRGIGVVAFDEEGAVIESGVEDIGLIADAVIYKQVNDTGTQITYADGTGDTYTV